MLSAAAVGALTVDSFRWAGIAATEGSCVCERFGVLQLHALGALEEHEVTQRRLAERHKCELDSRRRLNLHVRLLLVSTAPGSAREYI